MWKTAFKNLKGYGLLYSMECFPKRLIYIKTNPSNFLKAIFHKIYLVHSWILRLILFWITFEKRISNLPLRLIDTLTTIFLGDYCSSQCYHKLRVFIFLLLKSLSALAFIIFLRELVKNFLDDVQLFSGVLRSVFRTQSNIYNRAFFVEVFDG